MIGLQFLWTLCIVTSCASQMDNRGFRIDDGSSVNVPNNYKFLKRLENADFEIVGKKFDLSKMNISTLQKLNSLKSRGEFAKFFGLFVPTITTRMGGSVDVADELTGEKIPEAVNVGCAPVPTIVPLTPKADISVIYYPTCVLIEKCGGCCYGTLLSCQPVSVEVVKLNVMKIKQGTNVNEKERARPDVKQELEMITEERHKSCACKCVLKDKDCNKELQVYDANECSCKCKEKSGQSNCESKDANHYWDAKKCLCLCRKVLDCSTGEKFDQNTCKCASQVGGIDVSVRIGKN